MDEFKRITVRSEPLEILEGIDGQCVEVSETCIATKNGMNVHVRSDAMIHPDAEVYFYVKVNHPWRQTNGSQDYDEFVTDGDKFFIAFRPLGKQRLVFNKSVVAIINMAITNFTAELA
jgi:hypothetical protein